MIGSKYLNVLIALLMTAAILGTGYFMLFPPETSSTSADEPEYVDKLFNRNKIMEINISMDEADFAWIIKNANREEYRSCDITVNGTTFYNVGIRPKGNSSLKMVEQDENSDRFSFKVKFNEYTEGQTCFGLNKLALNNIISDKTYMKEYLAYDMFRSMGVVTPEYAYANITINGKPWGLYLAVEAMEESFVERNYGSLNGHLYRPEGAGSDLKWAGGSASNYSGIKNMAAYDVTDSDFKKIISMIEHLDNGTELEKYLDVDSILRYLAVNTFLVNFDSYAGNLKHNYYLYEEDGVCTILPWDLNLAFAGHEVNSTEKAVNFPIDTPVTTSLTERPLIAKLLEVPQYKGLYHKYLHQLVENYISSGTFEKTVQKVDTLINSSVKNDATAFYSYDEYEKSLPVLLEFARLRAQSIEAQLSGQQPATSAEQTNNTAQNIDATSIDLSALGGMGGKGPGGFPGAREPDNEGGANNANPPAQGGLAGGTGAVNDTEQRPKDFPGSRGPDNNNPGPDHDGFPGANRLEPETMMKVMKIMQEAKDGELSAEQMTQLKELGLDDTMIERMKNMPADMQNRNKDFPGGQDDPFGPRSSKKRITSTQIAYVAISSGLALLGLLIVWKFKKRKYSS
ncbi:MAG: CotH kinase family protein [Syntrophomonadaceae bacterium]|nr:CotH kinase family protein [Syntrophomonadaceae bacterium]MDD4550221.1 CotH kinase family protein [Syntrophomonadaceae bacterium]